ncbi:MAG: arginase family protein [Gemmatimonadota bacterium]
MDVHILVVPYDTARRGWRSGAGPEHLIAFGLVTHLKSRGHSVANVQVIDDDQDQSPAEIRTAFELARRLSIAVRSARMAGGFPLVLSGNCNSALGTLSGLTPARRSIFWFDAHGDCNTPDTTSSGFLDGTGLAMALGWCWRGLTATVPGYQSVAPAATFLVGVRDLDAAEAALIAASAITSVSSDQVPAGLLDLPASDSLEETLGYLHIDLDVLDPAVGQANSLPVPGGLTVDQLTAAIAAIKSRVTLGAAAITSYAPEYDTDEAVRRGAFAAIDAILGSAQ